MSVSTPPKLEGFLRIRHGQLDELRNLGSDFDGAWWDFFGTASPGANPLVTKSRLTIAHRVTGPVVGAVSSRRYTGGHDRAVRAPEDAETEGLET